MAKKTPTAPKSLGRQLNFAASVGNAVANRLLAPEGLTLAQWAVLSSIWRNGAMSLTDLAGLTGNAPPATSRIVDRMVAAGLLVRTTDRVDRRAVVIDLSEKGEALRRLQGIFEEVNEVLMAGMSEADRAQLCDLLARVETTGRDWLTVIQLRGK